jgi:hypothetical protein
MRSLPAFIAIILSASPTAALAGDTERATLRVETTVVSRCAVQTAPDGAATLRCTRGTAAAAIATPRGPEPLVFERSAPGRVTASTPAPAVAGTTRTVTIEF